MRGLLPLEQGTLALVLVIALELALVDVGHEGEPELEPEPVGGGGELPPGARALFGVPLPAAIGAPGGG